MTICLSRSKFLMPLPFENKKPQNSAEYSDLLGIRLMNELSYSLVSLRFNGHIEGTKERASRPGSCLCVFGYLLSLTSS